MSALRLAAALDNLTAAEDYVLDLAQQAGVPTELEPKLRLALEEIVVNIASYAYPEKDGDFEIECDPRPNSFCCTIRDWGSAFNPLEADEPDTSQSLEERPIGGLGLMLVTSMADHSSYARVDNANELTFCFSH